MNLVLTLLLIGLATSCSAFTTGQRSFVPYHSSHATAHVVKQLDVSNSIRGASRVLGGGNNDNGNGCHFLQHRTICYAGAADKDKVASLQKDIEEKLTLDDGRSYENFGPLQPIAESIDGLSGDWALSYADLSPATPKTVAGRAFLATNACYATAGLVLGINGDWFFGALTEIAGAVSFWYHYSQLEFGKDRTEVRLALLVDYFTAGAALITGGFYMLDMGITVVPFDALVVGAAAIVSLSLCWVWEFGYPYLFWHSLWHILSAYTGFLIGQAHLG